MFSKKIFSNSNVKQSKMPITKKKRVNSISNKRIFNDFKRGGFLFFKSSDSNQRLSITLADMESYEHCDSLAWDRIVGNTPPSYGFLESSEIAKVKKDGANINSALVEVSKCNTEKYKSYQQITDSTKRENMLTKKIYKFLVLSSDSDRYSSGSSDKRFKDCEKKYNHAESLSALFLKNLFFYMKNILLKCNKLSYPTRLLKSVKCIITFFNNSDLINRIFGSGSSSEFRSETSNQKTTLDKLFAANKYTEFYTIYCILAGKKLVVSGNNTYIPLSDIKVNMYFENKDLRIKFQKFLDTLLLQGYVIPAETTMIAYYQQISR
jgi:hypothetical protein